MKRIVLALAFTLLAALPALSHPSSSMTDHFIDVGRALDSVPLWCSVMMIDAGAWDDSRRQLEP